MDHFSKEMDGSQKKIPIEDLSKEDLVKKYKNLLIIAQKAKQAKDDAAEQIKKLTEQLNAHQQVDENDKAAKLQKEMSAMQEMLSTLTQQKLQFAMEMDKLRKQNVVLEKELKEASENVQQLRLHADELETTTESYKRQIQRLTEENDSVIKQMDVLDMELNALKAQKADNKTEMELKEKETELQTLKDEVERLMEENSRNKDSMKHLYENLHKEKCDAEAESDKLRMEIQTLMEELQASIREKETIIKDIKNVTENNLELTRVVKTISDERDKYFHLSEVLSNDKQSFEKTFKLEENRLQEIASQNIKLHNEIQEIRKKFEDANRDISLIKNENHILKTENECLNERLLSVMNDREKLYSECNNIECQLQNMLQQSTVFLQNSCDAVSAARDEKINTTKHKKIITLANIVCKLERNLDALYLLPRAATTNAEAQENNTQTHHNCVNNCSSLLNSHEFCLESDISENKCLVAGALIDNADLVMRLHNEIKLLNETLSNIETCGKQLECENIQLKELVNENKNETLSQVSKTKTPLQILEECQQCKEVEKLKREMCKLSSVRDSEEDLRNEIEYCRQSLRQKNLELSLCKEDLTVALSKQGFGGPRRAIESIQNCKDHNKLLEEISKLQLDNQNCKMEIERLQNLLKLSVDEVKFFNSSTKEFSEEPSKCQENDLLMHNSTTAVSVNLNENTDNELQITSVTLNAKTVPEVDTYKTKENSSVIDNFTNSVKEKEKMAEPRISELVALNDIKQHNKHEICSTKEYLDKCLQTEDSIINKLDKTLEEKEIMLLHNKEELEKMKCTYEECFKTVKENLEMSDSKLRQSLEENKNMQQRCLNLEENIGAINEQLKSREEEIQKLHAALEEANVKENNFKHYKEQLDCILKEKTEQTEALRLECKKMEIIASENRNQVEILSQDLEKEQKINVEKIAELDSMKEQLEKVSSSCERRGKDLEVAKQELKHAQALLSEVREEKNSLTEKLRTSEDAANSSMAAATKELAEVRAELASLHSSSQKELVESLERVKVAEQQCSNAQKQLKEANHSRDKLNQKLQHLVTGLQNVALEVSQISRMKHDLRQEVLNLKAENWWKELQSTFQLALEKCVNSQVDEKTAELLQDMQQMNELLKQRGESLSRLKEVNRELEQNLEKECSKVQSLSKDVSVKTLELEEREQMVQSLECELHKRKNAQEESLHVKEQTIHSLQKEVTKFKECQHELETKTSALEAKEEKIHNLEAELTKHLEKLQELKDKTGVVKKMEEEIKRLRVSDSAKLESGARVKELEEEIVTLKFRIQQLERDNENGDAPSEIMSGSTISRAEESSRLKDLEETFEERYTKLRTIAVRLKKKVSELTSQLNQLENEKKKLSTDKSELQTKVTAQAKNLQTMQQEYDSLQDIVETQKSELKSLKKTLEKTVNECESVKGQLQGLQEDREKKIQELEVCMKDKQGLEAATKEMASHIQNLKKEKENENVIRREKEKELKKVEEEIKLTERKLVEETEKHKNTLEQLENVKQECKKRSVLSLEMEDYERSLTDLTQQLASEKNKIKETENHLETQREISKGLQEQITLLEQRLHSEEARSKEVKDQLNAAKSQLIDVQGIVSRQETTISELNMQIELQRDQNESLVLQLSELAAEKHKIMDISHNQQEALSKQIQVLEDHALNLKQNLNEREKELAELKAEFENYKVRAQSVLRQKARPEDGSSTFTREDFADELAQFRHKATLMQTRLEDASSKIQTLTVENSALQEDRERMLQRCQELTDTIQDLRVQNSHLQDQIQSMVTDHREALKSQKLQAETLNQCYKKQLEELEERLQKETAALRQQLQLQKEQYALISANSMPSTVPSRPLGFTPITHDVDSKMEISLLEREEGEGSESVDSTSPHLTISMERGTEPVPLDKLLSMPVESEENVVTGITDVREQLTLSECRSKHLASLLSEAERDLAKLTQQNQVLKEEIRRQQRSVEREQHAQNFEYLKNVVFKFITLEGGDERTHLVPVLNTLLKLSPEEVQQLNLVAKGPDLTGVARGWTSYLHRWSGAQ